VGEHNQNSLGAGLALLVVEFPLKSADHALAGEQSAKLRGAGRGMARSLRSLAPPRPRGRAARSGMGGLVADMRDGWLDRAHACNRVVLDRRPRLGYALPYHGPGLQPGGRRMTRPSRPSPWSSVTGASEEGASHAHGCQGGQAAAGRIVL
jgi:hypothetical protein